MKTSLIHLSRVVLASTAARAAAVFLALMPFTPNLTHAATQYIGNSTNAPANGAPDGIPPLVILGEYNPAGPLPNGLELRSGSIQDVQYYGSNCDFTVYALSLVVSEPNNNEQVFHVDALEHFSANFTNEAVHILQATNFPVTCGELIAFAGIGPFYPNFTVEDQPSFDATYGDAVNTGSGFPSAFQATPPVANQIFTNGVSGDANSTTYDYIPDQFNNQGRYYAIGVDVLLQGVCTSNCISLTCPGDIVTNTCSNSIPVYYAAEAEDICTSNGSVYVSYNPPPGSLFQLGTTPVTVTAYDYLGNTNTCGFSVTVQPGSCSNNCVPPPSNMVLWLPFDEPSGNTSANLASPSNPGTQVGNPTPQPGEVADCLVFNGANYVTVPDYSGIEIGTNDLTIDAWINSSTNSTVYTNTILDKVSYSFMFTPWLGIMGFIINGQFYSAPIPPNYSNTGWHFVAVIASQSTSTINFYLDGAQIGTPQTFMPGNLSNTDPLWVGASESGWPSWVGGLDEVEIFNRALSTNDLNAIFNAGPAGKCKSQANCANSCIQFYSVSNIIAYGCGSNCVPVDYATTGIFAIDNCCTNPPSLTFNPPSGTCFYPGTTTTVEVTATSPCGYCNSTNFTVTVLCTNGACACTGTGTIVAAQNFGIIYNFTNGSDGFNPEAGLILSGNTLYGTAIVGGIYGAGTVFSVNIDGSGYTVLHPFSGGDGNQPAGGLILSGNTLYGTTYLGGANGAGTVFAVNTDGTGFTVLYNFTALTGTGDGRPNSDGAYPDVALVLSGKTLYGTATSGGTNGWGTVFAVNVDGTGFRVLYNFTGSPNDGANPFGPLVLSGSTLYGTTGGIASDGSGNPDAGTLFAINTNGTGFRLVHSFTYAGGQAPSTDNADGATPRAGLILSGSTLYGTTQSGGTSGYGTVFSVQTDGTGFINLHNFTGGIDGADPFDGLILSGNTLYGTTYNGGRTFGTTWADGSGTVYAININGTGFTTLHKFANSPNDGSDSWAGVILSGNTLYGTTFSGGTSNYGTIFALALTNVPTDCLQLECPYDIVTNSCTNIQVFFPNPVVTDLGCTNVSVVCTPSSGSYFAPGTTEVSCTATDCCGNISSCSFTVTVQPCSTNCFPIFGCVSNPPDLVQNGDFETFSSCPTGRVFPPEQPANQEIDLAVGWFSPNLATPDYYNSCAANSSGMSTPGNSAGYAVPHSGQAYVGAAMYVVDTSKPAQGPNASPANSYREYIETPLASPLQAGTTYVISFYVFLAAGEGQVGIDNVGAYLSPGALENYTGSYNQTTGAFALTPQVRNTPGNFITSTNSWTLVSGTYTATGGEDYLTIGNFYDNAHTPTTPVNPALYGAQIQAYYFVDDVSVSALCGCPPPKSVDACSQWSFDTPTAYDSCSGSNVSVTVLNTFTNNTTPLSITRTWLAADANGNTATCSQDVTLLQLPPFITYCPSNIPVCIVSNGCGYMPDATSELSASAADGGTFVIITQSIPPGTWLCADTTVTFTVSDCFGNAVTTNVPVILLPCTNNCVPPPTNMVLWLPFDETNGIFSANLASPPYPGTHVGNPMPLQGQHVANSLVFDGANYVTVPNYPGIEIGTNDLTIDAWVNLANTDSFSTNVIVDKGAFGGYALWLTPSWGLQFVTPNGYFSQGTPISAPGWHFVALSFNQTTGKGFFYVDGAVAGNPITMNPVPANLSNTNALWVGASSSFPFNGEMAHAWIGALDEVEIFNRALLTNDLNLIFGAGAAGKCKPSCYLQDISISRLSTNSLQITWSGSGILEQSTNLVEGWTAIQNATSPYVTPITTNKTLFFRLECP